MAHQDSEVLYLILHEILEGVTIGVTNLYFPVYMYPFGRIQKVKLYTLSLDIWNYLLIFKIKATCTDYIDDKLHESRHFILIFKIYILFILTHTFNIIKALVLQTGS